VKAFAAALTRHAVEASGTPGAEGDHAPLTGSAYGSAVDLDEPIRAALNDLPNVLLAELGEERVVALVKQEPEKLRELVREAVAEATYEGGRDLAAGLRRDGPAMLARRRAEQRGFQERLSRRWARPFDLAEMAMVVAYEAGEAFNAKHQKQAKADNDRIFAVLVRMHARACRIAEEVLALLKAGFGQAALARWRVLHEVAVVTNFIADHDQDTAERYLLHGNIEAWRAMQELHAKVDRLDVEPFTEEEQCAVEEAFDGLVARYGEKYATPYGWAQKALASHDLKYEKDRVTFGSIESAVGLDHLRPYYRMASHGTHANPKGILFTPDLLKSEPKVLLAGPGSTGFADAGQCALISLNQVTATLLNYKMGEAAPLIVVALLDLVGEVSNAFVETQRDVEDGRNLPRYSATARLRYRLAPRIAVARTRVREGIKSIRATACERLH
jgi:hypothetical protein